MILTIYDNSIKYATDKKEVEKIWSLLQIKKEKSEIEHIHRSGN
jgi:hypothetical protein